MPSPAAGTWFGHQMRSAALRWDACHRSTQHARMVANWPMGSRPAQARCSCGTGHAAAQPGASPHSRPKPPALARRWFQSVGRDGDNQPLWMRQQWHMPELDCPSGRDPQEKVRLQGPAGRCAAPVPAGRGSATQREQRHSKGAAPTGMVAAGQHPAS